jgi:hypothetical protein
MPYAAHQNLHADHNPRTTGYPPRKRGKTAPAAIVDWLEGLPTALKTPELQDIGCILLIQQLNSRVEELGHSTRFRKFFSINDSKYPCSLPAKWAF